MLDPQKFQKLEGLAVFFGRAIMMLLFVSYIAPYFAVYFGVALGDSDRAIISQIVSAEINVLLIIVGFLFGTSLGKTQQEATNTALATTNATLATAASPPPPKADVTIPPGGSATVSASDPASPPAGDSE